ncbi:serine/threonine-protein kinase [Jatrophihabitans endophyticus]|uniref:serine/threonine-protein kinase n=1 Tax=Jatrophihabitans endophyticus TaxID=1206085 RepID=UPI00190E9FCD|nr:serine/threonine-protein kinase [Jatrophihabitans endophyticus]
MARPTDDVLSARPRRATRLRHPAAPGPSLRTMPGTADRKDDTAVAEDFGPYRLEEVIGRGGMGIVYRAFDTRRDRIVALKRLPRELAVDEHFQARFRRESRLAARLNEPHIIPIHDFGEIDGQLFLDMRLVEGRDLGRLIADEGGTLRPELAVDVIVQVAAALSAAHEAGLMHRDIKPSNVLVTGITERDRTSPFAYLVDFGIARKIGTEGTALTTTTDWFGTVAYMAPERISGSSGDTRSDIYSLACLLYQCLVGQAPFTGEALQVLFAHVNNPPPSTSERRPGVPAALDAAIRRGMAKRPDDRFQTVAEFATAIRAAGTGTGAPVSLPAPPQPAGRHAGAARQPAPAHAGAVPRSGPLDSRPPQSGPLDSYPPRSGPPQSFPPRSGPPRSGPPNSVPPHAGPANSFPPRAGSPHSVPPRGPDARGHQDRALAVMVAVAVVVVIAAVVAVIVAVAG